MAKPMKIRAQVKNGVCEVKALLTHIMETGFRKDKATGNLIPAHFIQELSCKINGKEALIMNMGGSVSKNPFVSFKLDGVKKGDTVQISWVDNKGEKDSADKVVK